MPLWWALSLSAALSSQPSYVEVDASAANVHTVLSQSVTAQCTFVGKDGHKLAVDCMSAEFGAGLWDFGDASLRTERSWACDMDGLSWKHTDSTTGAALVERGGCSFAQKSLMLQQAGAKLIIIANEDENLFSMGGDEHSQQVTVPVVLIAHSSYLQLKEMLSVSPAAIAVEVDVAARDYNNSQQAIEQLGVQAAEDALAAKFALQAARESIPQQCRTIYDRDAERIHTRRAFLNLVLEAELRDVLVQGAHPPAAKKGKLAIFTQARNEHIFLPAWVQHYSKEVPLSDLYILDHESTDGSTSGLCEPRPDGCHVLRVNNGAVHDVSFLLGNVKTAMRILLQHYETVLFAEADEFVIARPGMYSSLLQYVDAKQRKWRKWQEKAQEWEQKRGQEGSGSVGGERELGREQEAQGWAVVTSGWEPIQRRVDTSGSDTTGDGDGNGDGDGDIEGPMKWQERPWLAQRRTWVFRKAMCKPLLTSAPLDYIFGFHCARNIRTLTSRASDTDTPDESRDSSSSRSSSSSSGSSSSSSSCSSSSSSSSSCIGIPDYGEVKAELDEDLIMVHMKRLDYATGHRRHMAREVERLKKGPSESGGAGKAEVAEVWRKQVQHAFDEWYFGDSKVRGRIDEKIKALI